jgi:hypothetical protein
VIYFPVRNISSYEGLRQLLTFCYSTRGFITYIYNVLTLLAADSAVSRMEPEGDSFPVHVSFIVTGSLLLPSLKFDLLGPVSACITPPAVPTPLKLVPGIPESGQHPGFLSETRLNSQPIYSWWSSVGCEKDRD